ncbi:insulinase family protein [Novosphingobium resinovorum]
MPLAAKDKPAQEAVWAFDRSDIPVDPDFRFGRLPNGMRYIVRHNATPAGTAIVRMDVEAGSLDESPAEQGFAHFLEHMAFNGSQRVPEGQMVPLLEREGWPSAPTPMPRPASTARSTSSTCRATIPR